MVRQAGPEPSNDAPGWSETRDFEACVSGMPISSSADFALGATIANFDGQRQCVLSTFTQKQAIAELGRLGRVLLKPEIELVQARTGNHNIRAGFHSWRVAS